MAKEVQQEIPGTERPKIKEIEIAADAYTDVRDRRMKLTEKEVAAREKLIAVVLEHKNKLVPNEKGEHIYRFGDDMAVVLKSGKTKVKVKHIAEPGSEDDDDE